MISNSPFVTEGTKDVYEAFRLSLIKESMNGLGRKLGNTKFKKEKSRNAIISSWQLLRKGK